MFLGAPIPVAISEHVPMVQWTNTTSSYHGVEIEIIDSLGKSLNFQPIYYKPNRSEETNWHLEDIYENDTQNGENETQIDSKLIEEVVSGDYKLN